MVVTGSFRISLPYGILIVVCCEQEQHLEQIRLAKTLVTNPLVPDDYDGSTYFAKLAREKAEV